VLAWFLAAIANKFVDKRLDYCPATFTAWNKWIPCFARRIKDFPDKGLETFWDQSDLELKLHEGFFMLSWFAALSQLFACSDLVLSLFSVPALFGGPLFWLLLF